MKNIGYLIFDSLLATQRQGTNAPVDSLKISKDVSLMKWLLPHLLQSRRPRPLAISQTKQPEQRAGIPFAYLPIPVSVILTSDAGTGIGYSSSYPGI